MGLVLALVEHNLDGADNAASILGDQHGASAAFDIGSNAMPKLQRFRQRRGCMKLTDAPHSTRERWVSLTGKAVSSYLAR